MKRARKKSSAKNAKLKSAKRRGSASKRSAKPQIRSGSKVPRKLGASAKAKTASDPLDHLIAAAAHALDLEIDPAWRSTVRANLHVIFSHASLVTEFPLPDDIEPAPVFRA
jgi:Protein of unknown function (DUF4089)